MASSDDGPHERAADKVGNIAGSAATILPPPAPALRLTLLHVLARLGENGCAHEVARCVRLCCDTWTSTQLWERVLDLQHAVGMPWEGRTTRLIHWAAAGDAARVVETLDRGARVNRVDSAGYSALYWAEKGGHAAVAAELVARGAVADATPGIKAASRACNTALIADLVARGADADSRIGTGNGWTSLMEASYHGHAAASSELLRLGAKVNARTNVGETALIFAARYYRGDDDVVRVLLAAPRVKVNIADRYGNTALSHCRELARGRYAAAAPRLIALLEAAGAQ